MRSQRAESVVVVVGGFWWAQPPWSGQWCQQELGWVGQVGWQHKVLGSRDGWRRDDSGKFWGNRFCCHGGGGWLVYSLLLLKTMSVGTQALLGDEGGKQLKSRQLVTRGLATTLS